MNGTSIISNGIYNVNTMSYTQLECMLKPGAQLPYRAHPTDAGIAQLVIQKVELVGFKDIWNDSTRGTGGFGSTGT